MGNLNIEAELIAELGREELVEQEYINNLYQNYKLPQETLEQFKKRLAEYKDILLLMGQYSDELLTQCLVGELDGKF